MTDEDPSAVVRARRAKRAGAGGGRFDGGAVAVGLAVSVGVVLVAMVAGAVGPNALSWQLTGAVGLPLGGVAAGYLVDGAGRGLGHGLLVGVGTELLLLAIDVAYVFAGDAPGRMVPATAVAADPAVALWVVAGALPAAAGGLLGGALSGRRAP